MVRKLSALIQQLGDDLQETGRMLRPVVVFLMDEDAIDIKGRVRLRFHATVHD